MTRASQSSDETAGLAWRQWFVLGLLALAGIALVARAVYLQVIDQDFLEKQGDARILRTAKLSANRGMVLDRNGEALAAEALHLIEESKITSLVVLDDERRPTGVIHLHDLLRAGIA